jgi:hypothetical protein
MTWATQDGPSPALCGNGRIAGTTHILLYTELRWSRKQIVIQFYRTSLPVGSLSADLDPNPNANFTATCEPNKTPHAPSLWRLHVCTPKAWSIVNPHFPKPNAIPFDHDHSDRNAQGTPGPSIK